MTVRYRHADDEEWERQKECPRLIDDLRKGKPVTAKHVCPECGSLMGFNVVRGWVCRNFKAHDRKKKERTPPGGARPGTGRKKKEEQ